jgi:hypothetical protein
MRKMMVVALAAAMVLTMSVGVATAAPTNARYYEEIELQCDHLGSVTVGIVNMGNWGTAKVVGSRQTFIPRWFEFSATHLDTGEVVIDGDREAKRNPAVDDVCRWGDTVYIEDDPDGFPDGWYEFEGAVGVRVVGRG